MFTYPPARRGDTADDYHGTTVADPYRWLEDPTSDETKQFVAAQSEFALAYLTQLPMREPLANRMTALWDTPRTYLPIRRGDVTVWAYNDGLANQPTYLVQRDGEDRRVLLNPNTLSDDGTIAVTVTSLSSDGSIFSYATSDGGTDWQVIRFLDTATGQHLTDEIRYVKWTSMSWHDDGFFYARFPETDPHAVTTVNNPSVCFHVIGTDQADDPVIFNNADDPDPGYDPMVSSDGRYLVLGEYVGTSHMNGLLYKDLADPDAEWVRLREPREARYQFLMHDDGAFLVRTNLDAPNSKIVSIPLDDPETTTEVVPEGPSAIENAVAVAGHIATITVADGSHNVTLHATDGSSSTEIVLPGLGSVAAISGRFADTTWFMSYESFTIPPSALIVSEDSAELFATGGESLHPNIEVTRTHATSTDGAKVGAFVLTASDTVGPAPVDLYGYGGFNINMTPIYNPARIAFLEAGGVIVVTNLRGGTELGEDWHQAGMLANKQQVFDDFIACAEHLIDTGVTTREQLSISGRSNGGLLTAATMLQRPDLFGAVVSHVPVTDMLRYQHFTAGRYWTVEFGDAADADAFQWLMEYSPLHNVDPATAYPPTLITTAEGDDRVVPMHSYKLAAELQHAAGGSSEEPLLVRIETRAGHGMGKPTDKLINEWADTYAFVLHHCAVSGADEPR